MSTFISASAGSLVNLERRPLGIKLPAGKLIIAEEREDPAPVGWVALKVSTKLGAAWRTLATSFSQHGLWPVVLSSLSGDDERPWLAGELGFDESSVPGDFDALTVLREQWRRGVPSDDPEGLAALAPFGAEFPGLAARSSGKEDLGALTSVVDELEGRLGLVPVNRPADVPVVLAWSGPINHFSDMGPLSAVLRSWEDRFGAVLVGVGFDTVSLAVERPPSDRATAAGIAAEHFAICPDCIWQGAGSIEAYADQLLGARTWQLWWD